MSTNTWWNCNGYYSVFILWYARFEILSSKYSIFSRVHCQWINFQRQINYINCNLKSIGFIRDQIKLCCFALFSLSNLVDTCLLTVWENISFYELSIGHLLLACPYLRVKTISKLRFLEVILRFSLAFLKRLYTDINKSMLVFSSFWKQAQNLKCLSYRFIKVTISIRWGISHFVFWSLGLEQRWDMDRKISNNRFLNRCQ